MFRKEVDGPLTHLIMGKSNSRQGGIEVGGDQLLVVEADDRDVVGDRAPGFA